MMEGTGERMESVEVNVDQRFEYFGSEAEGGGDWRNGGEVCFLVKDGRV